MRSKRGLPRRELGIGGRAAASDPADAWHKVLRLRDRARLVVRKQSRAGAEPVDVATARAVLPGGYAGRPLQPPAGVLMPPLEGVGDSRERRQLQVLAPDRVLLEPARRLGEAASRSRMGQER
jgi:hypothetical protein